jgi:hypothetical protein
MHTKRQTDTHREAPDNTEIHMKTQVQTDICKHIHTDMCADRHTHKHRGTHIQKHMQERASQPECLVARIR